MDKYRLIQRIEEYAPPDRQEPWDCSGWLVETENKNIEKIMLCLTVTNDIINQASEQNCDIIISHHPLFFVPFEYRHTDIYCAHTNLDITEGGTTDALIDKLKLSQYKFAHNSEEQQFLRYISYKTDIEKFVKLLKTISPNMRYSNPCGIKEFNKIAFCSGSGSEFIKEACKNGADALVTGDLKFHTALESPIAIFDIGHFESEIMVLEVFEKLINTDAKVVFAKEKSPFNY